MHSLTHSIFSVRNLILIFLAILVARSTSASLSNLDSALPSSLQSGSLEQTPPSVLQAFLQGSHLETEIELIPILAERTVIEEILGENDYFILTSNLGSSTRSWLAYLAPEGLSFDLTIQNATISLQSLAAQSQSPFETPSSLGISSASLSNDLPAQEVEIPYEIFAGIDLTLIRSSGLENTIFSETNLPEYSVSDFLFTSSGNIPEPSSALLLFGALAGSILKRKRQ